MATWEDVSRIALALPDTSMRSTYGQMPAWRVHDRVFLWSRPMRETDLEELGAAAPDGPALGARVESLHAKEALLAAQPDVFFTTSHFDGHPTVLARVERLDVDDLEELAVEAWLARAPKRLASAWLATAGRAAR
ncbi:MmcQ/YjbR family DNA-binding protein [Conexibacter sp. SYSU D00693]|uniref:MmcQ/YjbR family DNA-binding protein n=1 Tax=Conexibacter sp. SYSU D00693 TaxID=2812560 RepID=UPI00196A215E|nr:MmcQ/YjbR family DNA-binding protein [Conexibacter sp. SYSU D00693]